MDESRFEDGSVRAGRHVIEVEVDQAVPEALTVDVGLVESAIECILEREQVVPPVSVNVVLTGDERLRVLNRRFAGEDYSTDVLAFPADDGEVFPTIPDAVGADDGQTSGGTRLLGDIALSVHHIARQAEEHKVTFCRELAMLAIHGTLHLLGYDHATPEEERVMFGKTDDALAEQFGESAT